MEVPSVGPTTITKCTEPPISLPVSIVSPGVEYNEKCPFAEKIRVSTTNSTLFVDRIDKIFLISSSLYYISNY